MESQKQLQLKNEANEANFKIKKDLNKFCIECQEKDPKWCYVNNAIFVCQHCSDTRGCGVHISFVKSLDKDEFDPTAIKISEIGGNRKYLEYTQLFREDDEEESEDRKSKLLK